MSAIDEGIVREYFEQNGFLVRQARKYQVVARQKAAEEEIDLMDSQLMHDLQRYLQDKARAYGQLRQDAQSKWWPTSRAEAYFKASVIARKRRW